MNKIKIIGGHWRSRQIEVLEAQGLRPTPNRVRETLFNWLQSDIFNSCCLDLFAGSGALSFEAASRGATTVIQIENNPAACQVLKSNSEKLGAVQIQTLSTSALTFLEQIPHTSFDIVFIDPPFGLNLAVESCQLLEKNKWLSEHAKIYVESETTLIANFPKNWHLLKHKTAGAVAYRLFQVTIPTQHHC